MIAGHAERIRKAERLAMSQAWHAGVVAKSIKTPPLSQLLGDKPAVQTREAMLASLKSWAGATRHLQTASVDPSSKTGD